MASTTAVPVEEYLRTRYKPSTEYVDGTLRPKAMGTKKQGALQVRIAALLLPFGYDVATEVTVRLSATKFLIPDIVLDKGLADPYPEKPVLLCIEILSPEDGLGLMLAKCEEYHAWGVPYCWVFDPVKLTAWEYHRGGDPSPVPPSEAIRAGDIEISLSDLFVQK